MSLPSEQWRPIPGYEGIYEVSDQGRVRSLDRVVQTSRGRWRYRGHVLTPAAKKAGHRFVWLKVGGDKSSRHVHRLVLAAFVGPCPDGMEGCHSDGDPANNRLSNLRYDTHSGNRYDSVRHRTHHQTRKTHCPKGHRLVAPNLRASDARLGRRSCLACDRGRKLAHRAKRSGRFYDFVTLADACYAQIMATA